LKLFITPGLLGYLLLDVAICYHKFVPIINRMPLPPQEADLVQQTIDSVHLDDVLNVLLLRESFERQFVFQVLFGPLTHPVVLVAALFETATDRSE